MNSDNFADDVDRYTRFQPGVTEHNPEPSTREFKYMLFLVAYDIADPRRLRHVSKTCLDYGFRIEKSVFECDLPPERFAVLWKKLTDMVDEEEDAIVAYRICGSCHKQIESIGIAPRPEKPLCYVF